VSLTSVSSLLRHLRRVVAPKLEECSDHELLHAFVTQGDEASFTALVRRHGTLVMNVCRHVLGHEQDAEDAFQATFLVLARKAASLRDTASLAGFLHGVAYRLSLKAKRDAARRRKYERQAPAPASEAVDELAWRDVQALVEEEIALLPEKYRTPFIRCYLQGLSRAEAARELGVKEGTIWSRLSWARGRLQERLARRGVALSAALAAFALTDRSCPATLARLRGVVSANARAFAAGQTLTEPTSARVLALAQMGFSTFAAGKLKLAAASLLLVLLAGLGATIFSARSAHPEATVPDAKPVEAPRREAAALPRTDRHGDPLPDGAIARLGTVRWRHGFGISALTYSPDGKSLAAVGAGRALTLWDAATGKEVRQFPNINQPLAMTFSPDGKMIATTWNPYCCLWDVATGKEVRRLEGHQNAVRGVAFSPNGKQVATGGDDGTLRLWDPATGKEQRRIDCPSGRIAYSPDGKSIASTDMDGIIHFWDPENGKELRQLRGHKKGVWSVIFSPDGKRLASASRDGTLRLWDLTVFRQSHLLAENLEEDVLSSIAFSPGGALLASGHQDGTIRLWDVEKGTEKQRWQAGPQTIGAVAFSLDGRTLASGGPWGNIRLWDVATGRERNPTEEPHGYINHVRFTSNGTGLISISRDRRILWWDLATQTPRRQFTWTGPGGIHAELSPDGNTLAVGTWVDFKARKWEVRLWDVRSGKPGRLLGKIEPGFWPLAFSPDGRLVASGGRDHVIHLWEVSSGQEIQQIKDVADEVISLSFSPDSKALAWGTYPAGPLAAKPALHLRDLASGKERCDFNLHFSYVTSLAFSPDGKIIASGDRGREGCFVHLWDTATGRELCRHTGHREEVGAIAFSPDGKLVASGAGWIGQKDNSVHVWEAATGRLIRLFEGHHSCVGSVAFSPDGRTVASGGGDSTILLWDISGRAGGTPTRMLSPRELDACWTALANADAAKAYDAVWQFVAASEQAVAFLRKHLPPVPRPDAEAVARWIVDLDSDDFMVRQKASDELSKISDAITPAMRGALQGKPNLETRRRVQQLLDQCRDWTPERLRAHRAIQVLEHIGTKPAREVLRAVAAGAPEARCTEEAKESLRRMNP